MSVINPKGYEKTRYEIPFSRINIVSTYEPTPLAADANTFVVLWENILGTPVTFFGFKFGQDDGNATSYEVMFFRGPYAAGPSFSNLINTYNDGGTPSSDYPVASPGDFQESGLQRFSYPFIVQPGEKVGCGVRSVGGTGDEVRVTLQGYYNKLAEQF